MRRYRNTIIVLIVFVLLFGVYLFVTNYKNSKSSSDTRNFDKIIDLDTLEMAEITIENEGEKLVFVKNENENEWELVYPEGIRYDKSKLNSVAINFSSIFVEKVIEENATDLAQYGLDKPVVVSAKMKDGTVETLEIGSLTPTKGAYYVKKKDSNKVYTTDTYTIDKVKVKRNDIRDKALFTVESDDIIKVSMERKGSLVFRAERPDKDSDWTMTSPIEGNVNVSALSPMLDAITQATVIEYVEENPSDLEKYGLAKPSYVLEFETSEGKNRLLMGQESKENSKIYVMLEGGNEVCTISTEAFTFLDKPLKEIVEVFAYITNIWDVERIVVEMDGYTLDCELQTDPEKDTDKDKFFVNGKDASMKDENDKQPFRTYYQSLIGVTLSEVEPGATPVGEPEITFTYYRKIEPKVMKVEFIPKDDRYYYVMRNGKYSGILVEKKKFDEPEGVRESYTKLMEAINKSQ
ncbi:MAG: DUF4340 domain-containing protein [Firmicutes bacterium]|nr:DUF4340 domain-containing protein [Bacillota bacterium]